MAVPIFILSELFLSYVLSFYVLRQICKAHFPQEPGLKAADGCSKDKRCCRRGPKPGGY